MMTLSVWCLWLDKPERKERIDLPDQNGEVHRVLVPFDALPLIERPMPESNVMNDLFSTIKKANLY